MDIVLGIPTTVLVQSEAAGLALFSMAIRLPNIVALALLQEMDVYSPCRSERRSNGDRAH